MQARQRLSLAICFSVMLVAIRWIAGSSAHAQSADVRGAPSPATRPGDELPADSPIRKSFMNLADPDPRVRDQASENLMGISFEDLPKLRQLVIENQPLVPDQSAAMKDIVIQVYLAGQKYECVGGGLTDPSGNLGPFFLGLTWPLGLGSDERMGVPVEERIPGFPSYRYLRTGDMILGLLINPDATLQQFPNMPTHNSEMLSTAISSPARAQDMTLQVLRHGQILKVRLKMAPRPQIAELRDPKVTQQFVADRAVEGDRYWNENFAPVLGRHPVEDAE